MLIYRGMNVFPTAIRDLVVQGLAGRCEPAVRIWREAASQVRFEDPIAVDIEAAPSLPPAQYVTVAREAEALVRAQLQVRIVATVLPPGTLPRGVYKNALLATRSEQAPGAALVKGR
jgi:phenylacetate-CoA ligase/benzoylacetate-CoA ligase